MMIEEFHRLTEERLQKIIEEKKAKVKAKAKELKDRAENIEKQQEEVQKANQKNLQKCKKIPFTPSQEMQDNAFKNIIEVADN